MVKSFIYKTILFFIGALPVTPASASTAADIAVQDLHPGDVILIDLGCQMCRAINTTTGSPFNHSGLVIADGPSDDSILVAQSLTKTETLPLAKFLRQAKRGTPVAIRRPVELMHLFSQDPDAYGDRVRLLKQRFAQSMQGRPFDDAFLWDNDDGEGGELLYCSEMIQKTLDAALSSPLPTTPMDFTPMWDFWASYFTGRVPQGLPGNSPASFAKSPAFETVWSGLAP